VEIHLLYDTVFTGCAVHCANMTSLSFLVRYRTTVVYIYGNLAKHSLYNSEFFAAGPKTNLRNQQLSPGGTQFLPHSTTKQISLVKLKVEHREIAFSIAKKVAIIQKVHQH
jgi:hypothetical protein